MPTNVAASTDTNLVLATLLAQLGDDTFDGAVLVFVNEAKALFRRIEEQAAARENEDFRFEDLRRLAHRLAGVFLQFGFSRAATAASDLESGRGEMADLTQDLTELRNALGAAIAFLREMRGRSAVRLRTYCPSNHSSPSTEKNYRAINQLRAAPETFLETKAT